MITGAQQSFADQTGNFAFQFDITTNTLNQPISAGISGLNVLNFNFNQGKIYDPNNHYVGSYQAGLKTIISGNVSPTNFDYFINNNLIALGQPKSTGKFGYFYAETTSGASLNFNAFIAGTRPKYTLNNNIIFIPGQLVTGTIINNETFNTFRLFSGLTFSANINYSGNSTGLISAQQSGIYYLYVPNAIQTATYAYPVKLNTNFGDILFNLTLNAGLTGTGYFTDLNMYVGNFGGISGAPLSTGTNSGPVSFFTVSGLEYINTPFLDIYLTGNPSGITITGNIAATGNLPNIFSGNITGSITITGSGSGIISGHGGLYNQNLYTGTGSGLFSSTIYFTGGASNFYTILGSGNNIGPSGIPFIVTGYGTGSGYQLADINVTGNISGIISGLIIGSGQITGQISGNLTGIPSGLSIPYNFSTPYAQIISSGQSATGFKSSNFIASSSGRMTGIYNTGTNISIGIVTGNFAHTGLISGILTGNITGNNGILVLTGITGNPIYTNFLSGYISPTGSIFYTSPSTGDFIVIGNAVLGMPFSVSGSKKILGTDFFNYSGFVAMFNNTGSFGYFFDGNNNVPIFSGLDLGGGQVQITCNVSAPSINFLNPALTAGFLAFANINISGSSGFGGGALIGQKLYTGVGFYPFFIGTGNPNFISPTGYIFYNSPISGDYFDFTQGGRAGFENNGGLARFDAFTGLIDLINNPNGPGGNLGMWFNNGPSGRVPLYQAIDTGDHNTIQITITPDGPSGNNPLSNFGFSTTTGFINNSGNFNGGAPSGTLSFTRNLSGGSYLQSTGTFPFFPSGNFQVGSISLTGSGIYSGFISSGIGFETGIIASGYWPATGILNERYTGAFGSGTFVSINQAFTGIPSTCFGTGSGLTAIGNFTGYFSGNLPVVDFETISGFISGLITGGNSGQLVIVNYPIIQNISGFNYTGYVNDVIIGTGFNIQNYFGQITGNLTGILYQKTFTGGWNLKTGYDPNNLINFKLNNYFNSGEFQNPNLQTNLTGAAIYIEVDYMSYPDFGLEFSTLIITGYNTGIILPITGGRI